MSHRENLMCFAAFASLVALSGGVRADDYSNPDTQRFGRSEEIAQPMTCAQATAFAWFRHQMELSDGGNDNTVTVPAECERTYVANGGEAPAGDREVNEDSQ